MKKELETLIHAVRIYIKETEMEFGIGKCTVIVMKIGKEHLTGRMEQPN